MILPYREQNFLTVITCAQGDPAVICEKHRAHSVSGGTANSSILWQKCKSGSTVLGVSTGPAIATLIRSVSNFMVRKIHTIGLLEVFCRDLALAVLILFLLEQSKRY